MIPRLNYNSIDQLRSSDPGADESPSLTEHRFISLEDFQGPESGSKPKTANNKTPLLSGRSIKTKFVDYLRGFCDDGDGGGGGYGEFGGPGTGTSDPYAYRRKLGALGGVFAPVALGQLATNIFLRMGECYGISILHTHTYTHNK